MSEAAAPSKRSWLSRPVELYARVCQPDRDVDKDRTRSAVVAGLLSVLLPGLGQLHNRQLIRGIWWLVLTAVVLVVWGMIELISWWPLGVESEGWRGSTGRVLDRVGIAFMVITIGLWAAGVYDAVRTAILLRTGRLFVRFSQKKQLALAAAGFVPFAGTLTPDETCTLDELNPSLANTVIQRIVQRMIARKLRRMMMLGVIALGLVPIGVGAVFSIPSVIFAGAVVVLAALLVVLMG
jgi:hypothetical protein